jgi:lysophospholipase L1-like esterase
MPKLPRILLLGDSIRLSYQPLVKQMLEGRAEVRGPAENCQHSEFTLSRLRVWFEQFGRPDLVHWNNGLHDVGRNNQRAPEQFPLDQYLAHLRAILKRLQDIEAEVIWATTTPVHPTEPVPGDQWSWTNEDIDRYNAAARELMAAEGVPINDLHAIVWEDVEGYLAEDRIHLSEAGQRACAEAVVTAINDI